MIWVFTLWTWFVSIVFIVAYILACVSYLRMGKRQINFLGRRPWVEDGRVGQCRLCLKRYPSELKSATAIHHIEYEVGDPLAHTVEMCVSCHTSLHRKGRNHKGPMIHSFLFA